MTFMQSDEDVRTQGSCAVVTNKGAKRPYQQDAAFLGRNFVIVADGIGGHLHGDVAAKLATEAAAEVLSRENVASPDLIRAAFLAADDSVKQFGIEVGSGMWNFPGTTLLVAMSDGEGGAITGHLGDSRIYTLSADRTELRQHTRDHEFPGGALSRCIGYDDPTPDIGNVYGGTVILATDGLWLDVSDDVIEALVLSVPDPTILAASLVRAAAIDGLGRDNTTVAVWVL